MEGMTNLELCKRIAEIEGVTLDSNVTNGDGGVFEPEDESGWCQEYNPLTNKTLLWDLMIKHKVDIQHGKALSEIKIYDDPEDNPLSCVTFYHDDSGYERPVLLAIINKHYKSTL